MSGAATREEQKAFMDAMEKFLIGRNPSLAADHPYGFMNADGSSETKVVSEARWRAYQVLERWSFGVYGTPEQAFEDYPEIFSPISANESKEIIALRGGIMNFFRKLKW
jgi:hypothetical protein